MKRIIEIRDNVIYVEDTHDYSIIRVMLSNGYSDTKVDDIVEIYEENNCIRIQKSSIQVSKLINIIEEKIIIKEEIVVEDIINDEQNIIESTNVVNNNEVVDNKLSYKNILGHPLFKAILLFSVVSFGLAFLFAIFIGDSGVILSKIMDGSNYYLTSEQSSVSSVIVAFQLLLAEFKSSVIEYNYSDNWKIPILTVTMIIYLVSLLVTKKYLKKTAKNKDVAKNLIISAVSGLLLLTVVAMFIKTTSLDQSLGYEMDTSLVTVISSFSLISNALSFVLSMIAIFFIDYSLFQPNNIFFKICYYIVKRIRIIFLLILVILFVGIVLGGRYIYIYALGNIMAFLPVVVLGGKVNTAFMNFTRVDLLYLLNVQKTDVPILVTIVTVLIFIVVIFTFAVDVRFLRDNVKLSYAKISIIVGILSGLIFTVVAYTSTTTIGFNDFAISSRIIAISNTSFVISSISISVITYIALHLNRSKFSIEGKLNEVYELIRSKLKKGDNKYEKKV